MIVSALALMGLGTPSKKAFYREELLTIAGKKAGGGTGTSVGGVSLKMRFQTPGGHCTCSIDIKEIHGKGTIKLGLEIAQDGWTVSDSPTFDFKLNKDSTSSYYVTCTKVKNNYAFGVYRSEAEFLRAQPKMSKDIIVFMEKCSWHKFSAVDERPYVLNQSWIQ